jgi:hypothetical protein
VGRCRRARSGGSTRRCRHADRRRSVPGSSRPEPGGRPRPRRSHTAGIDATANRASSAAGSVGDAPLGAGPAADRRARRAASPRPARQRPQVGGARARARSGPDRDRETAPGRRRPRHPGSRARLPRRARPPGGLCRSRPDRSASGGARRRGRAARRRRRARPTARAAVSAGPAARAGTCCPLVRSRRQRTAAAAVGQTGCAGARRLLGWLFPRGEAAGRGASRSDSDELITQGSIS